jgi:AbrB family looped-hinge helix DNA binding protein
MTIATISSKGWIVIPADMRKKYALRSGARIMLVDYGGVLTIVPVMSDPVVEEAAGMLEGGPSLVKALLEERAQERAREG